jgi:DNA-binding NarL/FixJ family response regulator
VNIEFAAILTAIRGQQLAVYVGSASRSPAPAEKGADATAPSPLTKREHQVIALIACGYGTREIAETLSVATETVRTHVRNSMDKLGARTRAHLVALTFRHCR